MSQIIELLEGDHATAQQVLAQLDTNPLTTFTLLLLKEEKRQQDEQGQPNVVATTTCTKT